jgi:hypothetical protein
LLDPTNDCVRQGYRRHVHFNVKQKMVAANSWRRRRSRCVEYPDFRPTYPRRKTCSSFRCRDKNPILPRTRDDNSSRFIAHLQSVNYARSIRIANVHDVYGVGEMIDDPSFVAAKSKRDGRKPTLVSPMERKVSPCASNISRWSSAVFNANK